MSICCPVFSIEDYKGEQFYFSIFDIPIDILYWMHNPGHSYFDKNLSQMSMWGADEEISKLLGISDF